jgi:hypothetical protein
VRCRHPLLEVRGHVTLASKYIGVLYEEKSKK